jgi:hypothetical protein
MPASKTGNRQRLRACNPAGSSSPRFSFRCCLSTAIERFDPPVDSVRLAFAVINAPHFCGFVIEQPTPVVHDEQEVYQVYHYSKPVSFPAKNRVLSVSDQ